MFALLAFHVSATLTCHQETRHRESERQSCSADFVHELLERTCLISGFFRTLSWVPGGLGWWRTFFVNSQDLHPGDASQFFGISLELVLRLCTTNFLWLIACIEAPQLAVYAQLRRFSMGILVKLRPTSKTKNKHSCAFSRESVAHDSSGIHRRLAPARKILLFFLDLRRLRSKFSIFFHDFCRSRPDCCVLFPSNLIFCRSEASQVGEKFPK